MAARFRRKGNTVFLLQKFAALPVCALVLGLAGCGNFFVYPGSGTSSNSAAGNLAYVANSASGTTTLNGYAVSGGTLVAATGSPYSLGYTPSAMVVSRNNSFLYIATDAALNNGSGYIYGYTIGTGGALTILSGGSALESESVVAMDVSADGQWLFALDANGQTLEEYGINSSTGALTFEDTLTYTGAANGVATPTAVKLAPSGDFIAITLGTGGIVTFPFTTSTGAPGTGVSLYSPASASIGDYGLAIDSNNNMYVSGTSGLQVFSATTAGVPTLVSTTATGSGPYTVALDGTSYVYGGAQGANAGTIYGFSIGTAGALTALSPASVSAPVTLDAMAVDSSSKYLITAGYSASTGLQMFSIGSGGALTLTSSVALGTSTSIPTAIALTH